MRRLLACFILCFSYQAYAVTPPPLTFQNDKAFLVDFSVFPISSEMQMGKLMPMLQKAPQGIYLTVGGERSFKGASMMPNVTYLFQMDLAQSIVKFNLINKELLKAPNKEMYKTLRWDASFLDWKAFVAQSHHKNIKVHLTIQDFEWWEDNIRDLNEMNYPLPEQLNRYHKSLPCDETDDAYEKKVNLATILDYKSGNYLFDDVLYQRLHQLAVENRILTMQINLRDASQTKKLTQYLKDNKMTIGVMDFDNLYYEDYLGAQSYEQLLQTLKPVTTPQTLLIVMANYKDFACGQFQMYFGMRYHHVNQWTTFFDMQKFIDNLPKPIHDLMDGKLYEDDDALPQ